MRDIVYITLLCPKCNNPLAKIRDASKGNWLTSWRIKCQNESCDVDTGEQAHMAAVYESLAVMYFGAKSNYKYEKNK